jgi:hypothetical protein
VLQLYSTVFHLLLIGCQISDADLDAVLELLNNCDSLHSVSLLHNDITPKMLDRIARAMVFSPAISTLRYYAVPTHDDIPMLQLMTYVCFHRVFQNFEAVFKLRDLGRLLLLTEPALNNPQVPFLWFSLIRFGWFSLIPFGWEVSGFTPTDLGIAPSTNKSLSILFSLIVGRFPRTAGR